MTKVTQGLRMAKIHPGRAIIPAAERRKSFNCRISPSTAAWLENLAGSNGQKIDYLVMAFQGITKLVRTVTEPGPVVH